MVHDAVTSQAEHASDRVRRLLLRAPAGAGLPRSVARAPRMIISHGNFMRPTDYRALMSISRLPRGGHSSVRTGAVLLVLLAALMHVLGCAHGPTPTSAPRVDAVPVASADCAHVSGQPQEPAGEHAPTAPDGTGHCVGPDEPTVQPPRDIGGTAQPGETTAHAAHVAVLTPPAPRLGRSTASQSGTLSTTQARASLGIWRT